MRISDWSSDVCSSDLVAGAVPDVRGGLAAADVVVAPLQLAGGIQNKVLEAMAMARPVIASPQAAEGIDAVDGRDIIVANSGEDETAAILALLENKSRAVHIASAARARMEARDRKRTRLNSSHECDYRMPSSA